MGNWNRIVVKVGSSTLAYPNGRINIRHVETLVKILSDLKNAGHEVLLVSSGAIAMGVGKLNLDERPSDLASKQACAAVGQSELMYVYDKLFSEFNHNIAQVLLTGDDLNNEKRKNNIINTISKLLAFKTIPVFNENDTVSTEEITSIGDNDTLAALVSTCAKADLLILLSDIDGLYTDDPRSNPKATLISEVNEIDEDIKNLAKGAGTKLGTGGMLTKINAASICLNNNIDMVITNGDRPELIYDLLEGKQVGTLFKGKK